MNKKFPYYIFLLPLFYLLHSYNQLFGFIPFTMLALFFLKVAALAGIVFLIAYWFLRSVAGSSIIVFFVLLFTLYFGPYQHFVKTITAGSFLSSYTFLLPASALMLFFLCRYFIKRPVILKKISSFLGILLVLLCVTEITFMLIKVKQYTVHHNLIAPEKPICTNYTSCQLADSLKPDIYYLVLDEYTSNKALKELWNFDNSDFTNFLAEKGFHTLERSVSNYNFTPYSMSSTLNMRYIDQETANAELTAQLVSQSVKSVSDNETFCLLKKENYHIRFLAPLKSSIEDIGLTHEFGEYPQKQLYGQTLPEKIKKDIGWKLTTWFDIPGDWNITGIKSTYNHFYKRTQDALHTIKKIKSTVDSTNNRPPQFVLGHLLVTHKPHLYDSTGKMRTIEDILTNSNLFDSYTQQVQYANKLIKETVDHILKHNKKNTIIIIAGDHGFRELPFSQSAYYFPCLTSFYFPDGDYSSLYNDMSSVNIFRAVFNHSLCQRLPMLKDSTVMVKFKGGLPVAPR